MKSSTGHKIVTILGVEVSGTKRSELLKRVNRQLDTKSQCVIFTVNPEILLVASRDPEYLKILNSADINVADGVGLVLASVLTQQGSQPTTYPGRLLMVDLLSIATERKLKVCFLGTSGRVIKNTLLRVKEDYPSIHAHGNSGPLLDVYGLPKTSKDEAKQDLAIKQINAFQPDLLFVAFGAPKQERWIAAHKKDLNAKVIMSVGGSLDYFSGAKQLPPYWMETLGLEWLWRAIKEKGHYKRAFNAVIIFPLTVLFSRR